MLARIARVICLLVQEGLGVRELAAIQLIRFLSLFDISGSGRHISCWIQWNQAAVTWPITGSCACRLWPERSVESSDHLVALKHRATIDIESVLLIFLIISRLFMLSGRFQRTAHEVILDHE